MAYFACKNGNSGGGSSVGQITVQAEQSSVITCTDGSTVLTQTVGSSEEVVFDIPSTGDWTVSNGTKSKTFNFPFNEYTHSFMEFDVYNDGVFGVPFDFTNYGMPTSSWVKAGTSTYINSGDNRYLYIQIGNTTKSRYNAFGTQDKVDFTQYSKLTIEFSHGDNTRQVKEFDISTITGEYYVKVVAANQTNNTNQTLTVYVAGTKTQTPTGVYNCLCSTLTATATMVAKVYRITLS